MIFKKELLHAVFYASLFQFSLAKECPTRLLNAVSYEGSSFSYQNVATDMPVQWKVLPSNTHFDSQKDITEYDNTVTPPFVKTYAVSSTQLTILNSTVSQQGSDIPYSTAGMYILNYQNFEYCTGASLTVIQIGPACSCQTSDPNNIKLTCIVDFANYVQQGIVPILTWKDSNGITVQTDRPQPESIDMCNTGLQSSVSTLSIAGNDARTYQCELTFSAPDGSSQPQFIAANEPEFKASCFIANPQVMTALAQ